MKFVFKTFPFFIILSISWLLGCGITNEDKNDSRKEISQNKTKLIPYSDLVKKLKTEKISKGERKKRFFTFINQDVPNYWIGTKWDFNGVTRTPNQGKIACGYFVTNTLADFGFNIKRIYLAQQASSVMIKKLCEPNSVKRFSKFSQLSNYLKTRKQNDVFIVGLDYHTGYIIKEADNFYFLHSNYINKEGVIKEKTELSQALKSSNSFMIGSLMENETLF